MGRWADGERWRSAGEQSANREDTVLAYMIQFNWNPQGYRHLVSTSMHCMCSPDAYSTRLEMDIFLQVRLLEVPLPKLF